MIYTGNVFLHRWDLARATGQDKTLDPQKCAKMRETCCPWTRCCAGAAITGRGVEVPEGADVQTKLLGFIGRAP